MVLRKIFNSKSNIKKKLFIVGTGRSGTHLLARTLGSSSKIDTHIESNDFFKHLTNAAINKEYMDAYSIENLIKDYDRFLNKSKKKIVLDKTHPNLWLVDEINSEVENAFFIGIKRNVYATVNSMLNHQGVLNWYKTLDLEKPNNFLGINSFNVDFFKDLPLEAKCALRWQSHQNKLKSFEGIMSNFITVDYEDFYCNVEGVLNSINILIDEQLEYQVETLNKLGDTKWKGQLTQKQIRNIQNVIIHN